MVGILERRGMEFQQQRPRTGRPNSARPETAGSEARPLTTQTYPSARDSIGASLASPKPSPFRLQALEAGGLSSQLPGYASKIAVPSETPVRQPSFNRTFSDARQPTPAFAIATPVDTSRTMLASGRLSSDAATTPDVPSGSTARDLDTSIMYQMTASSAKQDTVLPSFYRPALYETANTNARAILPESERPVFPQSMIHPDPVEPSGLHKTFTATKSTGDEHALSDHGTGLYQPSAPASLRLPDTLEHEMPPRRELPFKRPGSHQSGSSRPSTSAKSVSHSTVGGGSSEPTMASATSPARNVGATRPTTASPLKRALAPSHLEPVKKALAFEARPQSHAGLLSRVSSPPRSAYMTASEGSFRRPSDLGELLRINNPLTERSPNSNKVTRMNSNLDAPYELETPPGTASSPVKTSSYTATSSPSRTDGRAVASPNKSHSHTRPVSPARPTGFLTRESFVVGAPTNSGESAALADYASQSREDRQTVMDEFMVSKLEDPNFAVLCEDLDSCWRRIALGL
jgi:hypothetical protein